MLGQKKGGSAADSLALAQADRVGRRRPVVPPLDLDEGDDAAPPGDQVDLALLATPVPRHDSPAAQTQGGGGKELGQAAGAPGLAPGRQAHGTAAFSAMARA